MTAPSPALETALARAEVQRRLDLCERYEQHLRDILAAVTSDEPGWRQAEIAGYLAEKALADQRYVDAAEIAEAMGEHAFAASVRAVRA